MAIRRGAAGDSVKQIQQKLTELGLYKGTIDSSFGGGTESGIKVFQKNSTLPVTGVVDQATWSKLFPGESLPVSPLLGQPIHFRCLALTSSFETGDMPPECFCGLTGDFDGQGISFGALQWNIGQGSLQPLLMEMFEQHETVARDIFQENFDVVVALKESSKQDQLGFTRSIQNTANFRVNEPWRGMLKALGRTSEFQQIQANHAKKNHDRAVELCKEYGLSTERGVALMFDIVTQNGSISPVVKAQIMADFAMLPDKNDQVARMRSVAIRRSAAANPKFVNDVRIRKLTIAEGQGTVHGIPYDLEEQFGLRLVAAASV